MVIAFSKTTFTHPLATPTHGIDQVLIPLNTNWPFDQVLTPANLDSFVEDIIQDWDCVAFSCVIPNQNGSL